MWGIKEVRDGAGESDLLEINHQGSIDVSKKVLINMDNVLIIGKEANKIEDQPLFVKDAQVFKDKKSLCKKILAIRQCDAEREGVNRGMRWRMNREVNSIRPAYFDR